MVTLLRIRLWVQIYFIKIRRNLQAPSIVAFNGGNGKLEMKKTGPLSPVFNVFS
jgi:hypothetical protein